MTAALDLFGGDVENVPLQHQHVAGDDGELSGMRSLDDDRAGPKHALLTFGIPGQNAAGDDHRIVRLELHRRRRNTQLAGSLAGRARTRTNEDGQNHNCEQTHTSKHQNVHGIALFSADYSIQPLRYSLWTNCWASGELVTFRFSASHSIFFPLRYETIPSSTASVSAPE